MEFVELVMLLIAVLLIWFKPEHEKLAWRLTIIGWLMVALMYVGHVSTSILGVLNLRSPTAISKKPKPGMTSSAGEAY